MEDLSKKSPKCQQNDRKILVDKRKSGRKRPWKRYKTQSLAVSDAYRQFEAAANFSNRMEECGAWLRFLVCANGHEKRLLAALFCQCRLCPMCQWRRSLIMFHQVKELAHEHVKYSKSDIPLLLTLTVPNVSSCGLNKRLDLMQSAWKRLMNRNPVKRVCRSWFRGLEVTYNQDRDDYHPHFHVLIMVPKNYFDSRRKLYIDRDIWLKMWQEVTGLPEITQVDIRRVKKLRKSTPIESVSAEVAKYATKPGDYIREMDNGLCEADKEVIETLHTALRRRRLVAFGGKFKEYRKQMKMQDIEKSDMVHIEEKESACKCRICESELIQEMYTWQIGLRQYVKNS